MAGRRIEPARQRQLAPRAASPLRYWIVGGAVVLLVALAGAWFLVGDGGQEGGAGLSREAAQAPPPAAVTPGTPVAAAERLKVDVIAQWPHDPGAFPQGLVWHAGRLYESTGLTGRSTLREVDPATGAVLRSVDLAPDLFGEGLALAGERLFQITWQSGKAFAYDRGSFEQLEVFDYPGEGWGLCYDGGQLVMSDGSPNLYFRSPDTFDLTGRVAVMLDGTPLTRLNELECVGEAVWANVWQSDVIVRIDKATGAVDAVVDAAGLLTGTDRQGAEVLNGIAYDPERDTFLITGKLWPTLFEVRFVPADLR